MLRRRFVRLLALSLLALLLSACARQFTATDVTGAAFGRDFHLTDHNGVARSLADFRGKVVVMFFGYTQCPDVCPTTMADLAAALQMLGADASRVQVLFVTVDPQRDTPELLRRYVPAFNPTFLGLYADEAGTAAVAEEFRIFYRRQAGATPSSYTVDHSAGTYAFDTQGRLRLFFNYGQGSAVFAHDIRLLLSEAGGS
jgi:protein SCO1/2